MLCANVGVAVDRHRGELRFPQPPRDANRYFTAIGYQYSSHVIVLGIEEHRNPGATQNQNGIPRGFRPQRRLSCGRCRTAVAATAQNDLARGPPATGAS